MDHGGGSGLGCIGQVISRFGGGLLCEGRCSEGNGENGNVKRAR